MVDYVLDAKHGHIGTADPEIMPDIVLRLRVWSEHPNPEPMSGVYAGQLMGLAIVEIERLRALLAKCGL